ncbi:hypothetical protein Tco_0615319 [Tanacetum coccineum]
MEYAPTTYQHQQSEFPQPDSGLIVPVFQKGDDPIDAINHMMSFLTAVVTSVSYTTSAKDLPQASGQVLTEEEIAFLADPGLPDIQTSQTVNTTVYGLCTHDVTQSDNLAYDLINQSEQIMTSSEQSNDVNQTETEITNATITIAFILSYFEKPLFFNLGDFSSTTKLKYSKNCDSLPPKETVRAGLETLGLVDEKNPHFTPTDLFNSYLLRIKYFSPIWRVLMLHVIKCLGGMQGSHDQLNINQQVIAYSLIWGLNVDIGNIFFSDLVAKLVNAKKGREPNPKVPTSKKSKKKKKIPSSYEPKTSHYVKISKSEKTVAATQHFEEPVATTNTTQSLDAFESAEELRSQPKTVDAKKSEPGSDTLRFITPNVDPDNSRLCKDPQHPTHESQSLRVHEPHSASWVIASQNKRVPKVLTFEGTELSPSVFLGQRTGDPPLHYKFTFSTNHLMHEHKTKSVENEEEDPLAINFRIKSLGNVDLDQIMKDQQDADTEITLIGSSTFDQEIEEAESDVESIPGDEILSISGEDNDEDESDKELSVVDEVVANNIIDELITEANKRDTNVFTATTNEVSSEFVPQSTSTSSLADVQALIAKALLSSSGWQPQLTNLDSLYLHNSLYLNFHLLRRKGKEELSWACDQGTKIRDFVYNGSLDLVFQIESEFHLATTSQLIRIQNAIKVDSVIAIEMYDKMIYVIKAKSGFVEAREVIQKNLDDMG